MHTHTCTHTRTQQKRSTGITFFFIYFNTEDDDEPVREIVASEKAVSDENTRKAEKVETDEEEYTENPPVVVIVTEYGGYRSSISLAMYRKLSSKNLFVMCYVFRTYVVFLNR